MRPASRFVWPTLGQAAEEPLSIAIMAMTTRSSIKVNPLVAFAAVRVFVRTIYFNVTYGKKIHSFLHKKRPFGKGAVVKNGCPAVVVFFFN